MAEHDEEEHPLNWGLEDTSLGRIIARFETEAVAKAARNKLGWMSLTRVVNLTPLELPEEQGAVIHIRGYMPLIRLGVDEWVMPMAASRVVNGTALLLAHPMRDDPEKLVLSDNDVRTLIRRLDRPYLITPGVG